ncbi:DNA-binding response OmpR family regulator [Bradyrhizobium japonicum]|uniref:DNA-binding response OmpR family regulator n=1 Tax=Bradyrhizobium japonicum TaxID=375 RepID=A0ABV2RHF3_BRAJP|nr:DNA-binding response OmpR family regulator [Bradyrhizobium japonicum]MCS3987834.1 DNA-binding response OmpR family regulator [Bradyrhizobium japonicum]MCS4017348.1 DNA-binding response OmpR family regulator [Bradyrhizobium japonicum]MCS4204445.1 DNA-binding response OmpR family regulator [Bradyrhizobium japonicum]MDH6173842.1 DNA-binding response OmpR family regulator [Bradyrhizobium japonicum]
MAIQIYLQRNHFRVTIADGEAGLRALENEQVDLMMIDIFMPHMRGRRVDPDLPRRAPRGASCCLRDWVSAVAFVAAAK